MIKRRVGIAYQKATTYHKVIVAGNAHLTRLIYAYLLNCPEVLWY
jgi:hypothetical protein